MTKKVDFVRSPYPKLELVDYTKEQLVFYCEKEFRRALHSLSTSNYQPFYCSSPPILPVRALNGSDVIVVLTVDIEYVSCNFD